MTPRAGTITQHRQLPSQEYLQERFFYDGLHLRWRKVGKNKSHCLNKIASIVCGNYFVVKLDGKNYHAHRLIWKYVYGEEPIEIDHISIDGRDNRIENLRSVTSAVNHRNRKNTTNPDTPKGVSRHRNKFKSWTKINGVQKHLGVFDTVQLAEAAVIEAMRVHHAT